MINDTPDLLHHLAPVSSVTSTGSNTKPDMMDKEAGMFRLKGSYIPFWRDETFRKLLRERVEFTLARYFQ